MLILTGCTATGKTALSVRLARELNGEIISADSMQIYKGMVIGTAAATEEEMCGIPHHLIGCIPPENQYSVAEYKADAMKAARDITLRGHLPIVVGGTGLYIEALLYNMDFTAAPKDEKLREKLRETENELGKEALHRMLAECDPETAKRLHPNDVKRVIRAIEIYRLTGVPMSSAAQGRQVKNPDIEPLICALVCSDREYLYGRINKRVDVMRRAGLTQEVAELLKTVPPEAQSMKAIGYRQLVPCVLDGADEDAAYDSIKQESRRYAKRQLTWINSLKDAYMPDICSMSADDIFKEITEQYKTAVMLKEKHGLL